MFQEVKRQYAKCNGHAFFSDLSGGELGMVQVNVPRQRQDRTQDDWLYHRNMVGILPSWEHLLKSGTAENYDWVINSELDHFMSAARVRRTIVAYLNVLRNGSHAERDSVHGPIMFMFGNAFVFNKRMVQEMRKQWVNLGKSAGSDDIAVGCPEWHRGQTEWPDHCSQDILYPSLPHAMNPAPASYGRSGCGQGDGTNSLGQLFPLACWEMDSGFWNPFGHSEEEQLKAVRELAAVQHMTQEEINKYFLHREANVVAQSEHFYMARQVPLIHHICCASVHKLAMDLLL